jgi:Na+/H+-dicarboxylate symporter
MQQLFAIPSFYAHVLNGIFLFVALILIYLYWTKLIHLNVYQIIMIFLILSIAVGVHGLSHLGLEAVYGYNPFGFPKSL